MATLHNAFIPQTILFFSLGAYFAILDINPLEVADKKRWGVLTLFAAFAIGDILSHVHIGTPINLQIHRLSLIFNIPALFMLGAWCVRHGYIQANGFQMQLLLFSAPTTLLWSSYANSVQHNSQMRLILYTSYYTLDVSPFQRH